MIDVMLSLEILQKKLFKFASVGIVATLTHAIIYLIFLDSLDIQEQVSNLFGFIIAFTVSYFGQRHWTFSDNKISNETKAKFKFFISSLLSLAFNALWVYLTADIFGLNPEYAIIGILFITPVIIFFTLNYWVFV